MMVREDTTKELMAAEITKWVDRLTQVRVKTTQKISGKKGYHDQKKILCIHRRNPLRIHSGNYAARILHISRNTIGCCVEVFCTRHSLNLRSIHHITNRSDHWGNGGKVGQMLRRTRSLTYHGRWDETTHHKRVWFLLAWKIEDNVLDFTHNSEFEMLEHLLSQCLKLTNNEKREKLKNMEFSWLANKYVALYFANIEKDKTKLKRWISFGTTCKESPRCRNVQYWHVHWAARDGWGRKNWYWKNVDQL